MSGEPLHKMGVAIRTTMLAAHIRVNNVWVDLRFGEDGFGLDLFDEHGISTVDYLTILFFVTHMSNT